MWILAKGPILRWVVSLRRPGHLLQNGLSASLYNQGRLSAYALNRLSGCDNIFRLSLRIDAVLVQDPVGDHD